MFLSLYISQKHAFKQLMLHFYDNMLFPTNTTKIIYPKDF